MFIRSKLILRCIQGSLTVVLTVIVTGGCSSINHPAKATSIQILYIQGFKIIECTDTLKRPELKEAVALLTEKLQEITKLVRQRQLEQLMKVPIYIEYKFKPSGAMWYHRSKQWLRANGYSTELAKCVEICNLENFIHWQKYNQPYMVLHELAHGYHDQLLRSGNRSILAAYQHAVDKKIYEEVEYNLGGTRKAYALTDEYEYFAELTEAYLGRNDYFPFNREQLKMIDPTGYQLMQEVWE